MPRDGVWAAPGRANLIGEHTDYNDGYVLPFALPHRTRVTASIVDSPEWTATSAQEPGPPVTFRPPDLRPGGVDGWVRYVAGVVWALREAGYDVPGATLSVSSDVPYGAGLSSSAALECAVLTALCDLGDLDLPLTDRPRLAQHAENDFVGAPTGIMDPTASLLPTTSSSCAAGASTGLWPCNSRSFPISRVMPSATRSGLPRACPPAPTTTASGYAGSVR